MLGILRYERSDLLDICVSRVDAKVVASFVAPVGRGYHIVAGGSALVNLLDFFLDFLIGETAALGGSLSASRNLRLHIGIDEDADMNAFAEKLSLKHYCEFAGLTYTDEALEAYKKENEDAKDLTADTTDMDAKVAFAQHLYQIEQAAQAAQAAEAPAEETESQETHSDAE